MRYVIFAEIDLGGRNFGKAEVQKLFSQSIGHKKLSSLTIFYVGELKTLNNLLFSILQKHTHSGIRAAVRKGTSYNPKNI